MNSWRFQPYDQADYKKKLDKNFKEKERRERENEYLEELKRFLIRVNHGEIKQSKLEKIDVLRETLSYCKWIRYELATRQLWSFQQLDEIAKLKRRQKELKNQATTNPIFIEKFADRKKEIAGPPAPCAAILIDRLGSTDSENDSPILPGSYVPTIRPIWRPYS